MIRRTSQSGTITRCLFRSSQVWLLDEDWAGWLREELRDRHVHLFGYRGADPDLVPALLLAVEDALSVDWWEFEGVRNFDRLKRMLAHSSVVVRGGNPSDALRAYRQTDRLPVASVAVRPPGADS